MHADRRHVQGMALQISQFKVIVIVSTVKCVLILFFIIIIIIIFPVQRMALQLSTIPWNHSEQAWGRNGGSNEQSAMELRRRHYLCTCLPALCC